MSVFLLPLAVGFPGMVQSHPSTPDLVRTGAVIGVASVALLTVFYLAVSRWHRRTERWRQARSMSSLLHGLLLLALLPALAFDLSGHAWF